MKKYRFARFLCWVLVVGGLLGSAAMILLSALGLFTLMATFIPFMLIAGLAGVLVAIIGFAFLAFFDVAEHMTARAT